MNIYVLAFSGDNTGRKDYNVLIGSMNNYICRRINNNEIVIFVSPNINLPLIDLIRNCKNEFQYNGAVNVYIFAPSDHPLNPICSGYGGNIIRHGTSGDFVSKFVNPALGWNIQEIQNATRNTIPIVLDPLIIIFTEEATKATGEVYGRPEWREAINSDKATFYDDNLKPIPINNAYKEKIRIAKFNVDNDYTVLFVKENDHGADKGGINNLLSQILNQGQWKNFPKEDIYVAVHALSDYAKGKDVDGFKEEFKNRVNYICDFHHTDDPLYKQFCGEGGALIKFLNAMNSNNVNDAKVLCDKLIELIKKMSGKDIRDISFLKHQIVNILEPLRIDIDGLMEKNFEDEYWKKVSNYWRKENLEGIFEDINDIIKKSLEQKVLGQDVKSFVDLLSKKIAELKKWYKVAKLLTALETGDKKAVQNICKLYGNVYKIWMDELINEFEKVKSNL
jgi:post-segregation antitoxin (ccd killing protein)